MPVAVSTRWTRKRFLPLLPAILPLFAAPAHSTVSLIGGLERDPAVFQIQIDDEPIAELKFDFGVEGLRSTEFETGWLMGGVALGPGVRQGAWPISGPDRFDDFSARWRGIWNPGKTTCSVRLRSDSTARLFVDGREALASDGSASGATTTLELEDRPHDFRLDYSHRSGEAFILLEQRLGNGPWTPLVPDSSGGGNGPGWEGEYFLGSEFEAVGFERIDEKILWNWGDHGPFNRMEDLPSALFRWAEGEPSFAASLSTNRKTVLTVGFAILSPASWTLEFEGTLLTLKGVEGSRTLIQFDQPGEIIRSESGIQIQFETSPDRPLRFWEAGGEVRDGEQAERLINRIEQEYENRRPILSGALAPLDRSLGPEGRWWVEMLLDRLRTISQGDASTLEGETAAAELGPGLARWSEVFAPELTGEIEEWTQGLSLEAGVSPFEDASRAGMERLRLALGGEYVDSGVRTVELHPEREVDWRIESLAEGLARWGEAFHRFEETASVGEDGVVVFVDRVRGEWEILNLPAGDGVFDLRWSETRARIEDRSGRFLEFRGPIQVRELKSNEGGDWEIRLAGPRQTLFEVGPVGLVSGAYWDGAPILLTGQGSTRKRGLLPGGEGVLRLVPTPVSPEPREP